MSRKRLGAIDPSRARDARSLAEDAARERRRAALGSGPPIAQVAGDVGQAIDAEVQRLRADNRALGEKGAAHDAAAAEGRLVQRIPLNRIERHALTRDRIRLDRAGEDWAQLKASLAARGQQTPIEVTPRPGGGYDLITGLRRLSVLEELHQETGEDRFASVLAFVRADTATTEKLVAMIEENEIRQDLSFFERGRIASLAAHEGLFADIDQAIDTLFSPANRNRRYKIRCFAAIHQALGGRLTFPEAIGERLGLALARTLRDDPGAAARLRAALARPVTTAATEMALLADFAAGRGVFADASPPTRTPADKPPRAEWRGAGGARVTAVQKGARVAITLDGLDHLDQQTLESLVAWLGKRMQTGQG